MRTVNGFVIVAVNKDNGNILGVRQNVHSPNGQGTEYVVAWMPDWLEGHCWGQGHYTFDFSTALDNFNR